MAESGAHKLSVVVPFYNVERYLGAALESIAGQTMSDLEVIMVDDGSADGSAAIAKEFAARDNRFTLVQQENAGLGPARNTGVRHASGEYLAFVDSDDVLPPHAYELLLGSLEQTGSDFAAGGVRRFSPDAIMPSNMHRRPFKVTALRTHVSRNHDLMYDSTAWNKVIRRSFWDAAGVAFPARLYEDAPVMVPLHVKARAVDMHRDVVYYYRVRQAGELSISQRTADLSNNEQRMITVREVGAFLAASAPDLKPVFDRCMLDGALAIVLDAFNRVPEGDAEKLCELLAEYLVTIDPAAYAEVDPLKRLRFYLAQRQMLPQLREAMQFTAEPGAAAEVIRRGWPKPTWFAAYPYFGDRATGVPDAVYETSAQLTLNAKLESVTWTAGGRLRIEGHGYIRRLHAPQRGDSRITLLLRNRKLRRTIRLRVKRVHRPEVTAWSGQSAASYEWSGFAAELSPRRLATLGSWRAASWELLVRVSCQGLTRTGPVTGTLPGTARWPAGRWVAPGIWLQPAPEHDGSFQIRAYRVTAFITGCRPASGALELTGWATDPLAAGAAVVVSRRQAGSQRLRVAAEPFSEDPGAVREDPGAAGTAVPGGARWFRARLPLEIVAAAHPEPSPAERELPGQDEISWDLSLAPGPGDAGLVRLAAAPAAAGARVTSGGTEITTTLTPYGNLSVIERARHLVVTQAEWTPDGQLLLGGPDGVGPDRADPDGSDAGRTGAGAAAPVALLLSKVGAADRHVIGLTVADGRFTARFDPAALPGPPGTTGALPLASGSWDLLARCADGSELTATVHPALRCQLPGYRSSGIHEVAVVPYRADGLRIACRLGYHDAERGPYAQRQLRRHYYPAARTSSPRDLAVFTSYNGLQCSCNPRAIFTELRRRVPDLECAWVTADGQFPAPDGASVLVAGSREHYQALATARYLVSNDLLPRWYVKRDGQRYLQTWHGTPLKRIGLDIPQPRLPGTVRYLQRQGEDVPKWDLLLSPNPFSTPLLRQAFGFGGAVAETGYPRNDLLNNPERETIAAAIRQRLGIPPGKRVVLYAPTWRDDAYAQGGRYRFDLQLNLTDAIQALGHDHVILLRAHFNVRAPLAAAAASPALRDVTHYPDIAELYLIADVLVTDYSSAMFDFAVTGRPMLFFTYDLQSYRDRLRGFYFDFTTEAPGPLLATSTDVIDALRELAGTPAPPPHPRYQAFQKRFCPLDDGRAATRAVDALL